MGSAGAYEVALATVARAVPDIADVRALRDLKSVVQEVYPHLDLGQSHVAAVRCLDAVTDEESGSRRGSCSARLLLLLSMLQEEVDMEAFFEASPEAAESKALFGPMDMGTKKSLRSVTKSMLSGAFEELFQAVAGTDVPTAEWVTFLRGELGRAAEAVKLMNSPRDEAVSAARSALRAALEGMIYSAAEQPEERMYERVYQMVRVASAGLTTLDMVAQDPEPPAVEEIAQEHLLIIAGKEWRKSLLYRMFIERFIENVFAGLMDMDQLINDPLIASVLLCKNEFEAEDTNMRSLVKGLGTLTASGKAEAFAGIDLLQLQDALTLDDSSMDSVKTKALEQAVALHARTGPTGTQFLLDLCDFLDLPRDRVDAGLAQQQSLGLRAEIEQALAGVVADGATAPLKSLIDSAQNYGETVDSACRMAVDLLETRVVEELERTAIAEGAGDMALSKESLVRALNLCDALKPLAPELPLLGAPVSVRTKISEDAEVSLSDIAFELGELEDEANSRIGQALAQLLQV